MVCEKAALLILTHHSRGRGGRPAAMGPGEERLDDHGVRTGGEVRLRGGPSVGRGRRRDGLFPARGAGELEPSEAALVAARDRDEVAVVHHARVPGAASGARRVAGRGGGQAQRVEADGWGRGGEGGGERRGAEEERRGRHFFRFGFAVARARSEDFAATATRRRPLAGAGGCRTTGQDDVEH